MPHPTRFALLAAFCVCALFLASTAQAASTIPELSSGLAKLEATITGPVAMLISVMAIVGCAAALYFGGSDMNNIFKGLIGLVILIGLAVSADSALQAITGKSLAGGNGALITASH